MQRTIAVNRIAARIVSALVVCLWFAFPAWSNADKDRKEAAKSLAKEIEQARFHRIYVPDFLDPSGARTEKGCFFASTFSTNITKDASNFAVVNRIEAQKQLNELHISPQDLQQPEILSKAAQALGADAVLVGTTTISQADARLVLSLRNAATNKEVHSMDYHEKLEPTFESSFPAVEAESDHFYYFPGLDGLSQPKCKHCPDPPYSDEMRRKKIEGTVLLSVRVDERGTITDVRLVKTPDWELAKQAVNILKKWRMEPSHDLDRRSVPVRVSVEIGFRLLN